MTPRRRILALVMAGAMILLAVSFTPAVAAIFPRTASTQSDSLLSDADVFSRQFGFSKAQAAPVLQPTAVPTPSSDEDQLQANMSIGDDTCLQCHGQQNLSMPLENGEILSLYIPVDVYAHSVHGEQGYACVQCHTNVGNYPHPTFSAADTRDASLQLYQVCQRCHSSLYALTQDSVHAAALEAGNRNAAVCSDCHTAHAVRQLTDPNSGELLPESRVWIPQTCAQCHYAIYQKYSTSVHGSALLGEGNPDVPTCIDCHGVHNIENPTTAAFRLKSPDLCAKCHTDPTIMDKYGIPTQVLDTYVADFHGTTVTLFEKESPDQETDKPVCFDCHGVHDIKRVDDPIEGLRIKENLLARCQVCHPDATANFPDAWLSHYIPSPERNTLVFLVDQFYKFFIPTVLGGMAILVVFDAGKLLNRFRKSNQSELQKSAEEILSETESVEILSEEIAIEASPESTLDPEQPQEADVSADEDLMVDKSESPPNDPQPGEQSEENPNG
jgi:nitrate reductase cytochrome c-type subunit